MIYSGKKTKQKQTKNKKKTKKKKQEHFDTRTHDVIRRNLEKSSGREINL